MGERTRSGLGQRKSVGLAVLLLTLATAYWILLGGTEATLIGAVRATNAAIAAAVIASFILTAHRDADALDWGMVGAACLFAIAGVFSEFPRASLDAIAAATAWVGAVFVGRRLLTLSASREFVLTALAAIGGTVAVVFAVAWLAVWGQWAVLTNGRSWPPLSADLPVVVYRHPHVIALLVLLTVPAILRLWRRPRLRPVVPMVLVAVAFVVLASGSRTAVGAAVLATVVVAFNHASPRDALGWLRARWQLIAAVSVAGGVVLVVSGLGQDIAARALTTRTLGARAEIWDGALQLFWREPMTGMGPGTFVQALPYTDYFQGTLFEPRHADNAVIQVAAEAGLLGISGLLMLTVAVGAALRRASQPSALWALLVFLFASFTDNPSDTPALVAIGATWLALAAPRPVRSRETSPAIRVSSSAMFGAVVVTYIAITVGSVAHDAAISAASDGDWEEAETKSAIAVALDPGMALYWRELGLSQLANGDVPTALESLRTAMTKGATDDVSTRVYAAALAVSGSEVKAMAAIEQALDRRPEPVTLLFASTLQPETRRSGASDLIAQALAIDPLLPAAESWDSTAGGLTDEGRLLSRAATMIRQDAAIGAGWQPMWLAALAGKPVPAGAEKDAESVGLLATGRAWASLMQCRVSEAISLIERAERTERRHSMYWFTRLVIHAAAGQDLRTDRILWALTASEASLYQSQDAPHQSLLNPNRDRRSYARKTIEAAPWLPSVPTGLEARRAWIRDPSDAAADAAADSVFANC